ncbi:hypothetical protein KXV89_005685 [Aspergillus fumigatus]|nr:hypothetical protein KXV89_005685 [Aspergillus fumigatus]KAH3438623.1 hypothetical protein KXV91_005782 [Aspergillus fumigatus]
MEEEAFQQLLWTDDNMEIMGYSIQSILPTPDRNPLEVSPTEVIEKAIGRDKLYRPIGESSTRSAIYWEGGDDHQRIFKNFMEEGLNMEGILRSCLRKGEDEVLHQPLRLVRFLRNSANLGPKKAHPHPNSVSIFRAFGGDVGYENGIWFLPEHITLTTPMVGFPNSQWHPVALNDFVPEALFPLLISRQTMEQDPEWYDSAIEVDSHNGGGGDDDDDDDDESTASLDDASRETEDRYGRVYSAMYQRLHPWPIDKDEQNRQVARFELYKMLFNDRLFHVPVRSPQYVLDIRTGTGSWAIACADAYPSAKVYGIDMILMQPHWYDKHLPNASEAYVASRVPPNCQFFFENIIELAWKNDYPNQDLIHVGEIGGDPKLLQAVLDGAFACCAPGGVIELWDCTPHLQDSQGISGLHRYVNKLRESYRRDGRDLDLVYTYRNVLKRRGFVHVNHHVYSISLHRAHPDTIQEDIIENWSAGLEASALELMHRHLGMDKNEISQECAAARKSLLGGVNGHLLIHVVCGRKP